MSYIETEDFLVFSRYILSPDTLPTIVKSNKKIGIVLLSNVLYMLYGDTNMSKLINRCNILNESMLFSQKAIDYIKEMGWKTSTAQIILHTVRHILKETSISSEFIQKITFTPVQEKTEYDKIIPKYILKSEYKECVNDWVDKFRDKSNMNSVESLKVSMFFLFKFIKDHDYSYIQKRFLDPVTKEGINNFAKNDKAKLNWLRIFLTQVVELENIPPVDWFDVDKKQKQLEHRKKQQSEIEHDVHRIGTQDIEILYTVAKEDILDELVFLLLLTTGIRVGGLVNIKLEHVAEIKKETVFVKPVGKALEKGGKWFSFNLNPRVKELIELYILKKRRGMDTPYLFPGCKTEHMSTASVYNIIKRIMKKAGLEGREFHPHAFRHTYAHILLECGNSAETVSKLLNHASVETTNNFYLKESSSEIAKRANIPWLNKEEAKSTVPSFLQTKLQSKVKEKIKDKHRSKNKAALLVSLQKIGERIGGGNTLETIPE